MYCVNGIVESRVRFFDFRSLFSRCLGYFRGFLVLILLSGVFLFGLMCGLIVFSVVWVGEVREIDLSFVFIFLMGYL